MADQLEARIRHLEMIQNVIARMANNSNTIKRYAVVITAAAVSFAKFADAPSILLAAAILILVLAFLDAKYLRLERCFRDLFNEVRNTSDNQNADFRLEPDLTKRALNRALFAAPVMGLYLPLVAFIVGSVILLNGAPECPPD
jgi:hypothetical protein